MDQRRFATLKFITTNIAAELRKKLKSIGPDLINFFNSAPSAATLTEFTQQFITIARRNNFKNICVFLMDQSKFSGLGNYLKCEILNHAAIHPSSTISQLSDAQLHTLFTSIKYIVESNTTQSSAKLAEYSDMMVPTEDIYQFVVYKRTTAADDSGIAIIKLKTPDKRTTYFKSSLEVQPPLVN
jgi:formamidopyrimidine-DNA glycosylase